MYFGLSEDQIFFQDNIKKFLEENSSVDILRKIAGDDRTFAKDIHDGIVNLGINSLLARRLLMPKLTIPSWISFANVRSSPAIFLRMSTDEFSSRNFLILS